ncbi:response regulator transcription factor [Candidatus Viridilinea mediisalina]|uniref:DNA-binding response regulator n=1 Tax=Candidatus Viridilinea mediisalina TaxID=2024553 RepID=A0A2A6RK60_9CHLR|nr:response regulator transcription factor [Candidatus Viridilinea mediisalina]PDW03494.1 DNA-binding response regulator [Candidatus Viridilinea mediisalina]
MGAQLLLADDDPQIRRLLKGVFEAEGYSMQIAPDGQVALDRVARSRPDLVLLELQLPIINGYEVCRRIRDWSQVPIIVLTACLSEDAKVTMLDLGADDYVTKPFGVKELLARIRVGLRHGMRLHGDPGAVVHFGTLQIDRARRVVTNDGAELRLTPTEYNLLVLLSGHAGKVLTHRMILRTIWGPHSENDINTLRVFVTQLRRKIEATPGNPRLIVTEPGVGYRFRPPDP